MIDLNRIGKKVIEFLKEPLIYIVIICVLMQIFLYSTVAPHTVTPDGTTYMRASEAVAEGSVDAARTPVYPIFINVAKTLFGQDNIYDNIVFMQKIVFVMAIVLFYYSIKEITKNKIMLIVFTIIFGISPYIIFWNTTILTETLSVFEAVLLGLLTLKYIKKPTRIKTVSIWGTIFLMVMTRPSFIYVVPIFILFWALRFIANKEEFKQNITATISCAVCVLLILGYCSVMKKTHGEFGITSISYVNQIVSAVDSKSYKNGDNEEIILKIDEVVGERKEQKASWDALNRLKEEYSDDEIKEFASNSIKNSKRHYIRYLVNKTIYVGYLDMGISYVEHKDYVLTDYQNINNYNYVGHMTMPINFATLYIFMAISIIYLIYNLFKNKKINWYIAFFAVMITANIFTLIVGAPFEPERLFLASIGYVLLLIIYTIDKINYGGKNNEKTDL